MNELTELQQAILSLMTDGKQRSQQEIVNLLAVYGHDRDDVVDALDELAKDETQIESVTIGDITRVYRSWESRNYYQMKHD